MKPRKWLLVTLTMGLMMSLMPAVAADSQPVTTQQRTAIERKLRYYEANATVLIGNAKSQPTIISNRVNTSDGRAQAISAHRLFPIASLEKGITGVALQQQYDQGKLSPTTKLAQYFPQVANSNNITVNNLATHTSGLADLRTVAPVPIKTTKDNVAFTAHNYRLVNNRPGSWFYANVNYGFIALIISQIHHESYHQYLEKQLIRPNNIHGMKFFEQVGNNRDVTPNLVKPNVINNAGSANTWIRLQHEMSAEYGAGQILATPLAYWQFINRGLLGHSQIRKAYLSATYLSASRQVHSNPAYYNGFYLTPGELHANGFMDGYSCTAYVNLVKRRSFVVFANNISIQKCRELAYHINRIYARI